MRAARRRIEQIPNRVSRHRAGLAQWPRFRYRLERTMEAAASARIIILWSVITLASGCSVPGAASSRTLDEGDVTGLPSGSAKGTSFSGVFNLQDSAVTACDCRVGSCADWRGASGDVFTLTQTDGALHVLLHTPSADQMYDGGIDWSGKFQVGGALVTETYETYSLLSGTVKAGDSAEVESQNTFNGSIGTIDYDCDVTGELALTYVSAL